MHPLLLQSFSSYGPLSWFQRVLGFLTSVGVVARNKVPITQQAIGSASPSPLPPLSQIDHISMLPNRGGNYSLLVPVMRSSKLAPWLY